MLKAATGSGPTLGVVASAAMSGRNPGGARGCAPAAMMGVNLAMVSGF